MTTLDVLNTTATIRKPGVRGCPFGLGVSTGCRNAGSTVDRMVALKDVPEERRKTQSTMNLRVYVDGQEGERCIYADKIVEGHDIVNCDYKDSGEGIRDFPIVPSPYRARIYNNDGMGGMYAYNLSGFFDGLGARNDFFGMFGSYASTEDVDLTNSSETPICQ